MIALLGYSTNSYASNSTDYLNLSTGELVIPADSVLISYNDLRIVNSKFIPLRDTAFVIRCIEAQDYRFKIDELYFVLKDGAIYGASMDFSNRNFKTYEDWYNQCGWNNYSFDLVEDYTDKEENKMDNLEKAGFIKN